MPDSKTSRLPDPAENAAYLDGLDTSAEELRELKRKEKDRGTKGDKIYVAVMAVLNIAVLVFLAWHLHSTGNWKDTIDNTPAVDPEADYYHAEEVFGETLAPMYKGVRFPDGIQASFRPIYSANEDTIGWIRLDGTSIDYPVMQSEDNEKYERRNFYLESDHRGSVWMDYRNAVGVGSGSLSKVTIIYGHHLTTDECIFAELEQYMDVNFYKTHPVVEMNTIYNNYKWKVFACFITNVDGKDDNGHVFYYWDPYIKDSEMTDFTGEILKRSWFINPAVDVVPTDKLLCLSTCTYIMNKPNYVDVRCVVMARLVRDGESDYVDVTNAYQNDARRMPQLWYTQNGLSNPYATIPVFNDLSTF